ncbi:MAG TPA: hypothetical protein VNM14_12115 [Planctomycetota bacterium]|nr:hypothetical protein [Planctomycetota bacterium]
MNLRTIASSLVLACVVGACSGGGSAPAPDPVEDGAILKISYFRAFPEAKTKRLKPAFRAVMSKSWQDRMGDGPREPLAKAAPREVYLGYLPDVTMAKYVKKLQEFGLEDLKSRKTEELKPEEWSRLAVDPQQSSLTRIFTVGTDKGARSFYYRDQQTDPESIQKFVKCEAYILRACEYAVNVQTMSDPLPGREK